MSNTPKIDKGTIISTSLLILALINQALQMFGISAIPIDDAQITTIVTLGFTVGTAVWAWWRNNNITKQARDNAEIVKRVNAVE